jgi:aminoglycoside phosphotransferase (APT) family kinase protein
VEFRLAERAPGAFQQSVNAGQVRAMCRRAFGEQARPVSVTEFGYGTYNSTYRVSFGSGRPVVLRVAPDPSRQFRAERDLMRNEYASVPYLAPVAPLLPRTLAVDFTRDIAGRDYLFQTMLDGVPAPDGLAAYPRPAWTSFFRQLGGIARRIHGVEGERFGPVAGPGFATWSTAVVSSLEDIAADLDDAGLDAGDVRATATTAQRHRVVLDEISQPRLLHGDLWTVNLLVAPAALEPTITGVCDCDRTWWGDPEADWCIFRAGQRPGTERDAFWDGYGSRPATPEAAWRALIYQARHIGCARLERHRLGNASGVAASYHELRAVLDQLPRYA